jgi:capsular exopolysaccharide synthesis family protein
MKASDIFEYYESESPIATELRRLYHNLTTLDGDKKNKSFLVTSSERGEGKSTITSHLALTVAQFPRKKVVVVDADFRRPRIHQLFGLTNAVGLISCLRDLKDPMSVVQDTRLDNLKVVTSGGYSETPAQLFETDALTEFMEKMKFYFDVVIVDGAPILAVSDTLFLCNRIDAVLFVVLVGRTPKQVVKRAKEILVDSKANIAGVVVNNASEVLPYYYDYKYYGYGPDRG